jgi:CRP-like cAMP-binding protein
VTVVEKVSLRSVPSRVAKSLLEQAEKAGSLEDGGSFRLSRTQTELAQELATSRESVARALGDMRRKGIISTSGRNVKILSSRHLVGLAKGEDPPVRIDSK